MVYTPSCGWVKTFFFLYIYNSFTTTFIMCFTHYLYNIEYQGPPLDFYNISFIKLNNYEIYYICLNLLL